MYRSKTFVSTYLDKKEKEDINKYTESQRPFKRKESGYICKLHKQTECCADLLTDRTSRENSPKVSEPAESKIKAKKMFLKSKVDKERGPSPQTAWSNNKETSSNAEREPQITCHCT